MFNQNLNRTSTSMEVKEMAKVLQKVKTTIRQKYPYIVVNLKAERKGVKTTINAYGTGVDKIFQAYVDTRDLLEKNGLTAYPLAKPTPQSEVNAK